MTLTTAHPFARVQHQVMRRQITVQSVQQITPRMRRVVFADESLRTFTSLAHDDHIKIFFPHTDGAGQQSVIARDFTPRRFDAALGLLTIDFALHDHGIATEWARRAKAGDSLEIGGPRGSHVIADDFDWYLLIGDETALPAIARRLEELRPGVSVTSIIVVADESERQPLQSSADLSPHWLYRASASQTDERLIRDVLQRITFPSGDGHIWLAGESAMVRSLRDYLINDRAHNPVWLRAAGYWKRGSPGAHEHL